MQVRQFFRILYEWASMHRGNATGAAIIDSDPLFFWLFSILWYNDGMKSVFDYFVELYKENKQIVLLTWCYSIIAIIFVIIAGLIALINQPLGVSLLIIPLVSIIALAMNVVFWALIHLAIDSKSKKKTPSKSKK